MAHHTHRSSHRLASTLLASTLGIVVVAETTHAATLRVGSGLPYATIQSAVSAAAPGDTILVMPGTYRSTTGSALVQVPSHLSNLTIRALIPGTVILRKGGFPGRSQRGIGWHATGGVVQGIHFRNFRNFNGAGILATRSGLTVRNCEFHGNRARNDGGAIHFDAGPPSGQWMMIEDCRFLDNDAFGDGGAIHAIHEVDVRRSTFEYCDADRGGAVFMEDARGSSWIESSEFKDCTAQRFGGAIAASDAWLGIADCDFLSNESAIFGGAVWAGFGSDLAISASDLTENVAGDSGGAVSAEQATISIMKSSIVGNEASHGGALDLFYAEAVSNDTTWSRNSTSYHGGAIVAYRARLAMDGNLFEGQSSGDHGGAVFADETTIEQVDVTYMDNAADGGFLDGGAIWLGESTLDDADGVYTDNAGERGGAIHSWESVVRFDGATFEGNVGTYGAGAIHTDGSSSSSGGSHAMTIASCDFIANESLDCGGALAGDNIFDATDCVFDSNLAYNGGHVHLEQDGSGSSFVDCRFDDGGLMHAGGYGGALWAEGITGGLVLDGCTGTQNDSGWWGGAFRVDADTSGTGTLLIANCDLTYNVESVDGDGYFLGDGGQLHVSGRMMTLENSHLGGAARRGGAVAGLLEIDRCTLDGLSSEAAGAAWLSSGSTVTDSVLDGGTDGAIAAVVGGDLLRTTVIGVRSENDSSSPGYSTSGTTAAASVDHATDCWFGAGGQAFVAIIAGTDSGNIEDPDACRMDFDHDGDIDADDLAHLSAFVGTIEWGHREDLDDDGDVDADDVATITAAVGTSCS